MLQIVSRYLIFFFSICGEVLAFLRRAASYTAVRLVIDLKFEYIFFTSAAGVIICSF